MLLQDPFAVPLNNEEQSELQITHTVPPKEVCKESRRRTAASDLAELTFECCSRTSANKENIEEPENEEETSDRRRGPVRSRAGGSGERVIPSSGRSGPDQHR